MPKIVIVGAGPGLGHSLAERFGREGWRIVLIARNAERLAGEVSELRAQAIDAQSVPCDVTDFARLDALIGKECQSGGIEVLVHNAAVIRPFTPLLDTPVEAIGEDIAIDLTAGIVAARSVLAHMRERGSGTILFSGGQLGFEPWPDFLTLGVAKAGLRNCAFALANDPANAALRIAYVNIHAAISREVGDEIAEVYFEIHSQQDAPHQWDVHFERPYDLPS